MRTRIFRLPLIFALTLIVVSPARSQSFPELLTLEEILKDPTLADLYYETLRTRFKNSNFDEVLFKDNPSAKSPRLSKDTYRDMLDTLRKFTTQNPDELPRLLEIPEITPFQLHNNGTASPLSDDYKRAWGQITQNLEKLRDKVSSLNFIRDLDPASRAKVLSDLGKVLGVDPDAALNALSLSTKEGQDALIGVLINHYNRSKDAAVLSNIADSLIIFEAGNRIEKMQKFSLQPFAQYVVLEDIEKSAVKRGKELKAPGKLFEGFSEKSSLMPTPRSAFFRKGTTLLPMSRLEAVFKGIGPGECVRSACNRYFDAFFDDSVHLKILKDGKETGFIGIYKSVEAKTGRKTWFIETIQSPLLADNTPGSNKTIRGLLKHLQQLATLDDSQLMLPASTFNSYNYKEVLGELESIPEATSGTKKDIELRHADRMKKFENFTSSDLSETDQLIARNSGYSRSILTNGLTFNENKAVTIGIFLDQPDWVVIRNHELSTGKPASGPIDLSVRLDPLERARMLKEMNNGYSIKQYWFDLYHQLERDGKHAEAAKVWGGIYEALPEELRKEPFSKQYDYVEHQVNNVVQSEETAQALKDELMLKATSWEDYKKIIYLGDKGEGLFAPFLLSTIDKFSDQVGDAELLDLYSHALRYMHDDQFDLQLTRKFGSRLKTPESFVKLVKMMNGEDINGAFSDEKLRNLYVAENWERFFPTEGTWRQKLRFAEGILDRVSKGADLHIRQGLMSRAKNFKELAAILKLSNLLSALDSNEQKILSKMVGDSMVSLVERSDVKDLTHRNMDFEKLQEFLFKHDLDRVRMAFLGKATNLQEFENLLEGRRIQTNDLLAVVDSSKASEALKEHAKTLIKADILNNSFFDFEGTSMDSALASYKIADVEEIIAEAQRAKLGDYLKWRAVLKGSNVLTASDAKNISSYIRFVRTLPIETQMSVYKALIKQGGVIVSEVIKEHGDLLRELEGWANDLETKDITKDPYNKLTKVFSKGFLRKGASVLEPATTGIKKNSGSCAALFSKFTSVLRKSSSSKSQVK